MREGKSPFIEEGEKRTEIPRADGQLRYMKNAEGVTVGEYDAAKGEIRLYPGATVADVVHEFTHPLVDFARREAAAGRGEFLNKIKEIIDAERATWEQPVRDAYKGKGEEEILEEIFTHAMGEKGAKLFGKSTNTLQGRQWYKQLWEKIKGLWQDFATKMGWNKADLRGVERMSPEDAAQKILSEMAKGRNFGDAPVGGMEGDAARLAKKSKSPIDKSKKIWYNTPQMMAEGGMNDRGTAENPRQPFVVGERREVSAVNRTLAKVASLIGGDDGAEQAARPLSRIDKQRFLSAVSSAAREEGTWFDDVSKIADTKHVVGSGQESVVYPSRDGKSVIKVNNFKLIDSEHSPQDFFDGIKEYNELRPDLRLDVIGFTENEAGEICAVTRQPHVNAQRHATQEEIDAYFKDSGFTRGRDRANGNRIVYRSNEYSVLDAEPRNVLVGKDGELYPIDLIVSRNKGAAGADKGASDNSPLQVEKRDGNNITIAWRNEDGEVMRRATLLS